jgi:predicted membrane protein
LFVVKKRVNDLLIMFIWFFLCPFSLASEAQGFSTVVWPWYASAAGLLHSVDRVTIALVGYWAATGSMELPAQPVLCFSLMRHRAPLICSLSPLETTSIFLEGKIHRYNL